MLNLTGKRLGYIDFPAKQFNSIILNNKEAQTSNVLWFVHQCNSTDTNVNAGYHIYHEFKGQLLARVGIDTNFWCSKNSHRPLA